MKYWPILIKIWVAESPRHAQLIAYKTRIKNSKSTMAAAAMLILHKSLYVDQIWTNFDQIWQAVSLQHAWLVWCKTGAAPSQIMMSAASMLNLHYNCHISAIYWPNLYRIMVCWVNMVVFGPKTANINCKKRQSLLNTVVIGHQRNKQQISNGREEEKGSQWKDLS